MAGSMAILYEHGTLGWASWKDDPLGSFWIASDFGELSEGGLIMLDYSDRGRWRRVKPRTGEYSRQEFFERDVLTAHAPGVGLSRSLKRLMDGDGIVMDGHATGMSKWLARPASS
jgi:hypothetical protein